MIDAVPRRQQALPIVLAGSGLRVGEVLGLQVGDLDMLREAMHVQRQRRTTDDAVTAPKGGRTRFVPMTDDICAALAQHLAEFPSDSWVFTNEVGQPLTYRAWRYVWDAARKESGVRTTNHMLRHYLASSMLSSGGSLPQTSVVLGHSSSTVTLRVYAHLMPGDDEKARAAMGSALSGIPKAPASTPQEGATGILRTQCGLAKPPADVSAGQRGVRPLYAFLVSQKMAAISSIFARRSSATATSVVPFVPPAPASLVAWLNRSFRFGYFSKCGALK